MPPCRLAIAGMHTVRLHRNCACPCTSAFCTLQLKCTSAINTGLV
jgi:hypothetical protein